MICYYYYDRILIESSTWNFQFLSYVIVKQEGLYCQFCHDRYNHLRRPFLLLCIFQERLKYFLDCAFFCWCTASILVFKIHAWIFLIENNVLISKWRVNNQNHYNQRSKFVFRTIRYLVSQKYMLIGLCFLQVLLLSNILSLRYSSERKWKTVNA